MKKDFNISAKKFKMKNLYKINGVGIDHDRFTKQCCENSQLSESRAK